MQFNDVELMPNGLDITTTNIAGIGILGNEFECDFFTATTDKQRDMRLLCPLWLINCTMNLIIFPFKDRFILCPHCKNDLNCLAQIAQAFGCIGIFKSIGEIFVLVPASSNAEVETAMAHDVNCTRHFSKESRVAITVAGDHLSDTDTFGIAS